MAAKKLFLLDGSAIFYRSYFAFIRNPLINSKGENTSAAFGFLSTVFKLIEDERPEYLIVVFDTKEPTFRHKIYDDYKATREKMPDDMVSTIPRMRQALISLNLCILEKPGYEADDIIATIARQYASEDLKVYIISGDKDLAQLVSDNISIYAMGKGANQDPEIFDRSKVKEKYGVFPEQITDWLAMMGDKSDNIPGIPSVGEKTAIALIEQFESLENLYQNLEEVSKEGLRERIKENQDKALISKELVILEDKVPLEAKFEDFSLKTWDKQALEILLKDMEFNRLITRAAKVHELVSGESTPTKAEYSEKETNYIIINDLDSLDVFINDLEKQEKFVFDLETDSLDTFTAQIAGIAISYKANTASYIVVNHPDSNLKPADVFSRVQPVFKNPKIKKIAQNIKFDTMVMRQNGIEVENLYFDTMIASFLVNSSSSQHNLDALASEYLDYHMISIKELIGSGKNQTKMTDLMATEVFEYACEDADITWQLMEVFTPKLKELELESLFYELEMPLVEVLIEMEEQGVSLDLDLLKSLSKELTERIAKLEKEIYSQGGEEFNLNSPQQLGTMLFDKLEIHKEIGLRKPKRTKTGQYSTSEQVLERYHAHPLPKSILDYRKLAKLKNTYVDALPDLIHPKTGRVHTSFNQTIAATGRLSSVNPNLQNIPIRTEIGRQMRKAFKPAEASKLIMSADYSQIELRIMAHLSDDKGMCTSFEQDLDIHVATAAKVFGIDLSEVTDDQRRKAKEINFGIIYGMSKYGLSNRLEITVPEAEEFIFSYFATYPKIQDFMRNTISDADKKGYVTTMKGRRRYMPQIHSSNRQLREFAERTSINTPIQGSAADMIKIAMIDIHRAIKKANLKSKMILQVHDELVFEVPKEEADQMNKLVKEWMEKALELHVPVKVEIGTGKNWLEAH
jgi:DNA polymerase-1